jgi:hypothetical protein
MKEHESALFSEYIIDGIRCESTPADMLKECMDNIQPFEIPEEKPDDIIDETIEPPLTSFTYDDSLKEVYLSLTTKSDLSSPGRTWRSVLCASVSLPTVPTRPAPFSGI